jgi:hypothetical protein
VALNVASSPKFLLTMPENLQRKLYGHPPARDGQHKIMSGGLQAIDPRK